MNTDKLGSYGAAHRMAKHYTNQYANHRAEVSHQPAVVGPLEAILGKGRPQGVAGDPLQPIPLIGGHANAGMQIEAPGEREESGDPRRSLEERYTDHAGFVEAVSRAAARSVVDRTLLEEDAATIITIAEESDILRP